MLFFVVIILVKSAKKYILIPMPWSKYYTNIKSIETRTVTKEIPVGVSTNKKC